MLVGVFAGLNYLQGPKLARGNIDSNRAVLRSDQQLRLFANQAVSAVKADQVDVAPAAPFTVSSSGKVIAVQFTHPLHYDTRYTVRVHGVANAVQPSTADFSYSFVTAPAEVYYLDRADPVTPGHQEDRIMRTDSRAKTRTVVYSAARIQEFAVLPNAIAVTTLDTDGTSSLSLVSDRDRGFAEQIVLPGKGSIDQLHVSPDVGILGFVFTSAGPIADRQFAGTLMTVNLAATHTVAPILDIGKRPLAVTGWSFISGSTEIVAQSVDQTVLRIDPTKPDAVIPLGQFQGLGASSTDGRSIVVADAFGTLAYALDTGKQTRLPVLPIAGSRAFGSDTVITGSSTKRLRHVTVLGSAGSKRYENYLVEERDNQSRVVYQPSGENASIEGFSVSPNGQFVAVEVIPDFGLSVSDGYSSNPQSTSITTMIVDVASGRLVSGVPGFDLSWR